MTPEQLDVFMQIERDWRHDSDRSRLIAHVDKLIAEARADALEVAARLCRNRARVLHDTDNPFMAESASDCANAIEHHAKG